MTQDQTSPSSQQSPRQPVRRPEASTLAQLFTFIGPLIFAGGGLALWRTGEQSVFYALLMPVGLIVWLVGFIMGMRQTRLPDEHHGDRE